MCVHVLSRVACVHIIVIAILQPTELSPNSVTERNQLAGNWTLDTAGCPDKSCLTFSAHKFPSKLLKSVYHRHAHTHTHTQTRKLTCRGAHKGSEQNQQWLWCQLFHFVHHGNHGAPQGEHGHDTWTNLCTDITIQVMHRANTDTILERICAQTSPSKQHIAAWSNTATHKNVCFNSLSNLVEGYIFYYYWNNWQ